MHNLAPNYSIGDNFKLRSTFVLYALRPTFVLQTMGQFHQHSTSSFYMRRSQKRKKDWQLDCLFALSGSASVKASHIMLMKLTPCGKTLSVNLQMQKVLIKWWWSWSDHMCKSWKERLPWGKGIEQTTDTFLDQDIYEGKNIEDLSLKDKLLSVQFHQHFMHKFFMRKFVQSQNLSRKKLLKRLLYKNVCVKCWWNWLLGRSFYSFKNVR